MQCDDITLGCPHRRAWASVSAEKDPTMAAVVSRNLSGSEWILNVNEQNKVSLVENYSGPRRSAIFPSI